MSHEEVLEESQVGLPIEAPAEPTLEILRHSAAHLLAKAVLELYPGTKYDVGPPIEDGFFYNFMLPGEKTLTEAELVAIEDRMHKLAKENIPFEKSVMGRQEARGVFEKLGQDYKVALIDRMPPEVDTVGIYTTGPDYIDLCRGPHVPHTGFLKQVKLMRVAGVYWRGDENNDQLQRVYGTAWFTKDELYQYLQRLEDAKARDHKKLGKELDLFYIDDAIGKGLPMWLPNGATVRRVLERYIVDKEVDAGYQHVYTPHIANTELYRQSGHLVSYKDSMYPTFGLEDEDYVLKPMNCPHHINMFAHTPHSYRDLPVRLAELGTVYRYEKSGELAGLIRVRGMNMNDAHIFCRYDQIREELIGATKMILECYKDLGITDYYFRLSCHDPTDPKFQGNSEMWERGEKAIRDALQEMGAPFVEAVGEAAFYGPKVDVQIRDALGREFTASTTQLDFLLPERFNLEYVAEDGSMQRPAIIHRAPLGTMERLMAFLIEQYAGHFPLWLAPVQCEIIPVQDDAPEVLKYIDELVAKMKASGLRAAFHSRPGERMQSRIREAELHKVPYVVVVGKRDLERGDDTLNVRNTRTDTKIDISATELVERLGREAASKSATSTL